MIGAVILYREIQVLVIAGPARLTDVAIQGRAYDGRRPAGSRNDDEMPDGVLDKLFIAALGVGDELAVVAPGRSSVPIGKRGFSLEGGQWAHFGTRLCLYEVQIPVLATVEVNVTFADKCDGITIRRPCRLTFVVIARSEQVRFAG